MPELPLDHRQRHPLPSELDRVSVAELMLVPTSAQHRYADISVMPMFGEGPCSAAHAAEIGRHNKSFRQPVSGVRYTILCRRAAWFQLVRR